MKKNILCNEIRISGHALQRMFERGIIPAHVMDALSAGEVIKEYEDDKPYPSYLILNFIQGKPIHAVVSKE